MRLLIISDLWGKDHSDWVANYVEKLQTHVECVFYDSCQLAEINTSIKEEEKRHQAFVSGGIERAVENLIKKENKEEIMILGFSIGGTIAWKFALKNNLVKGIFCISSTRLRKEVTRPHCIIYLFYGTLDNWRPKQEWFELVNTSAIIVQGGTHEMYREEKVSDKVSKLIIKQF